MNKIRQLITTRRIVIFLIVLVGLLSFSSPSINIPAVYAQESFYDPTAQTAALLSDEANTVYLGNLARRDNGVPPLRWNLQLTHAARWFSWDSVENRVSYCGHQDTLGGWPGDRALTYGYLGGAGAENAFCGYVTPQQAIDGWMNSPGHRANLLAPGSREIGLGYYRRGSTGPGYVTQDFGSDAVYAPVIIENEAISTNSPNVNLYIYDRSTAGGYGGFAAATQMMVSNNANFSGATWEPYNANKAWTLTPGSGWRTVYVKTRDAFNRSLTASDSIYLGGSAPANEIGDAQMSTTQAQVMLSGLNGGALPQVQFSLGWLADDASFVMLWGNGGRVNDASGWGGTAYRLYPGNGESSAWVYDTSFIKNTPMVAYFRLKVNNNTSTAEVARVEVTGGPTKYGPLSLRGTDFSSPNQYQEFPLAFTFSPTGADPFLIFQFWGSGSADVYVDAVSIFTAPQPIESPLTWSVPGGNYRGQGIWMRYTDGSQFSPISEATILQSFTDVPPSHPYWEDIETLYAYGLTGGCQTSPPKFCPDQIMNRGQAAAFMLRGNFGPGYMPPTPTHIFQDDWTKGPWAETWAEGMRNEGFSAGCLTNPPKYCPWDQIPREQAVIFALRLKYGKDYIPPPATGTLFADMTNPSFYATAWAEQAYKDGLIPSCGTSGNKPLLCPKNLVSRGLAAYMIVRAKNLSMP